MLKGFLKSFAQSRVHLALVDSDPQCPKLKRFIGENLILMKTPKYLIYYLLLLILLPGGNLSSHASQKDLTWSELVSPKIITRSVLEYGLSAARSVLDLTYDEMLIDLREGTVEVSNLVLMPILDWDDNFSCRISIPRLSLVTSPTDMDKLAYDSSSYKMTFTAFIIRTFHHKTSFS